MIAIVDYGLGNIAAFANVYKKLNIPCIIAKEISGLNSADRIILPGVGAFDHAMQQFNDSGLRDHLVELVTKRRFPVLGVCVGMQMLAGSSEEGKLPGLGWIEGHVRRFNPAALHSQAYIPHMGWNDVVPKNADCLFRGLEKDARFYFLHSYCFEPVHAEDVLAETEYFTTFASSVRHDNVWGVQFHPEKSHQWGVQLLKNFAEL